MFNDDDNNLWESSEDEEEEEELQSRMNHPPTVDTSANVITKKTPLKLVIKRLQHPTRSSEIKYKSHTLLSLIT